MEKFDLAVIGSGPGGYVAAVRASQLGLKTACIEKDKIGGICLNWGCIPTKALLKNAEILNHIKHSSDFGVNISSYEIDFEKVIKRSRAVADRLSKGVEMLFKKNNITKFSGIARFLSKNEIEISGENNTEVIWADKIIVATGARSRTIPGISFDGNKIISSKEAMILPAAPKSLIIVGAGAIGVEFAYFYNTFGTKVTLIEMMPKILPVEDGEVSKQLEISLKKQGIKIYTSTKVQNLNKTETGVSVEIETSKGVEKVEGEKVLVAIGVQANTEGLNLEKIGVEINRGYIVVDKNYKTNVDNIFAIGDVIGPPLLAHKASAEAINCVEKIVGISNNDIDYSNIPGCTFSSPQVGSIGLTEDKAKEKVINYAIGKFPYSGNGKAIASAETEGFVKLIFDKETDELLGGHIIGYDAAELLAEISLAKQNKLKAKDIIKSIHSHPTLSELIMESAAIVHNEAIHF
ncbi:MAG TPA: dihydrolipoyl dehydrogenase [Bacteroidota bacterium]|nr:dihydrolipoyl dehydrogenase [Bacteroidota bacterium]